MVHHGIPGNAIGVPSSGPGWRCSSHPGRGQNGSSLESRNDRWKHQSVSRQRPGRSLAGVPFVTFAGHPHRLPFQPRAAPAPSQAGHHPGPSYDDATVSARRDYGVVPMWSAPHGNHTGMTSGRHRDHTSPAGAGDGDGPWPWNGRFPACGHTREASLSQTWTVWQWPLGGGLVCERQINNLGSACAHPAGLCGEQTTSALSCGSQTAWAQLIQRC